MYSTPSNDTPKFAPSKKPSSCNLSNTKVSCSTFFFMDIMYRCILVFSVT